VRSWSDFRAARPAAHVIHLDSAAAGRSSVGTLRAVAEHAELEAETGAYVAQDLASGLIGDGRARLAGLLGVEPAGLIFTESATSAMATLLSVWPLAEGDTVAVVPSEWGPNLAAFTHRGLRIHELPVTDGGTIDIAALGKLLADAPPAAVHLTQVASHRPLVQPVAAVAEICRAAGVPLWVDAAQALGHVDTASGADAIYAPSRKWLTGPRGVGMLAVNRRWWDKLLIVPPRLTESVADVPPLRPLEFREAHAAGWVGLAQAVSEFLDAGPEAVWARLAAVGALTRGMLGDLPGWEVVGEISAPSAITALRPTDGQDVATVRARLLAEHRIVTTAAQPYRAPGEMKSTYLRVSPHVDCTEQDLNQLHAALRALT
jgi:pyridoxal 5-phosphate dependent beta-lyase